MPSGSQDFRRFVEREDIAKLVRDTMKRDGFRTRYHTVPPKRIRMLLFVILLGVVALALLLITELLALPPDMPVPTLEVVGTLIVIALLSAGTASYTYELIKRLSDIITYTEFQTMLVSRSLSSAHDFVLIVNRDNKQLHADGQFMELFTKGNNGLDAMFTATNLADMKQKAILEAIEKSQPYHEDIQVKHNGEKTAFKLMVYPLPGLEGFSVLLGEAV